MKSIRFFVPLTPVAQKRHRDRAKGKGGFAGKYDPSVDDKKRFLALAAANRPPAPIEGPIAVGIRWWFRRPKSHYRTGKFAGELKPGAPEFHIVKPDEDNLSKLVYDSLEGMFYYNDSQIAAVIFKTKMYCTEKEPTPGTDLLFVWDFDSYLDLCRIACMP